MAQVALSGVNKSFGSVDVIRDVDLEIEQGEFVVFVGPSGCGKSTLLRLIAGLESLTSGEIHIADKPVMDLPPSKRGIAMVFQSYALYPHMTVFNNMAFSLDLQGLKKKDIHDRVVAAAKILQMEHLLDRRPAELSGGQRQRVAIGRSIVRNPDVFLFDEPLSNLDAALRHDTRVEIAKLHRQLKATTIYVTHDQVEAKTLADKIVVLKDGQVMQVGAVRYLAQIDAVRSALAAHSKMRNKFSRLRLSCRGYFKAFDTDGASVTVKRTGRLFQRTNPSLAPIR